MEKETNKEKIEMTQKNDGGESAALNDGYFGINKLVIDELMTKYEHRKTEEDLVFLNSLGGDIQLAQNLKTNFESGIREDPEELDRRLACFGENKLEEEELKHCCEFVLEALGDMMLQILIVAAIVQIVLGSIPGVAQDPHTDWIDGLSIVVAVIVVVAVGSITNYQKEKKFKQLNDTNNDMMKFVVTRNGHTKVVKSDEILVGDIVNVSFGMILPADGILVDGSMIKMDESPLTGESNLILKETLATCMAKKEEMIAKDKKIDKKSSLPSPVMFSGTLVKEGKGKCMIMAVGSSSMKGKIREIVKQSQEADDSKTPLEEKLDTIAEQIGYFGLISAVVTLVALFIQFGVNYSSASESYTVVNQTYWFNKQLNASIPALNNNTTIQNALSVNNTSPSSLISQDVLNIFMLCIAIIVVAIPEGLPLAVTLALAFSINKMMKENNLVRKMQACETMGGANYICSDKTGTLTRNIMSIVQFFDGASHYKIDYIGKTDEEENQNALDKEREREKDRQNNVRLVKDPKECFGNPEYYKLFKLAVLLNIDATINAGDVVTQANKSDQAFIDLFKDLKENLYETRTQYLQGDVRTFAFSSDRKRMSTLVKSSEFPTGYRLFIKGASDYLLEKFSTHYIDPNTCEQKIISDVEKINFDAKIKAFANEALRTIVVAYKDISEEEYENFKNTDENGDYTVEKESLVIIGLVGISDTLRPKVPESVLKCQRAGITVVMVTGDLKDTAVAIAKNCNIIDRNEEANGKLVAMTGEEFYTRIGGLSCDTCGSKVEVCTCPKTKSQAKQRGIDTKKVRKDKISNMEEFKKITKDLRVIARCRPMDKYALVVGLRKTGNVVAVTGDGTNDAPALSRSDVGFAMGIQGTDIAKDASDIIIMDDNFNSIVTAVLWGRNIFDNIRKFIQFQLSVNLCACILVFITACIGNETPLKTIQMLWVNLIMDSLGSLALATEPPNDKLLERKPYKRSESIINPKMWKHILLQAIFGLGVLLFLYLYAPYFIVEDNINRIAESNILYYCFGDLPGKLPVQNADGSLTYYILDGSQTHWSSSAKLKTGMTAAQCGDYGSLTSLSEAFNVYNNSYGATSHITIVFNTFVFYILLNQINARVIDDSFNIFYDVHKNWMFILVTGLEMVLQVILVEVGSIAFQVSSGGLTGQQWGVCLGFAAITFPVAILGKVLPLEGCIERALNIFSKKPKSNKVANVNDLVDSQEKDKNQMEVNLNVEEEQNNVIRRETSSKKKDHHGAGLVNSIVRSRSKGGLSKHGSHHSLRKDKT